MRKIRGSQIIGSVLAIILIIALVFASQKDKNILNYISAPFVNYSIRKENEKIAKEKGKTYTEIISDMNNLQKENIKSNANLNQLKLYKEEIEKLSKALELKNVYSSLKLKACRVISKETNGYEKKVIIDAGLKDGIQKDMVVIAEKGLYGRVISVNDKTSKIALISDPSMKVSVITENEKTPLIMSGSVEKGILLKYIPENYNLITGQNIFTSGEGGIYPPGIYIGKVGEVVYPNNKADAYAYVNLEEKIENTDIVLIVTGTNRV